MYIDFRKGQKKRERSIDRLLPIHAQHQTCNRLVVRTTLQPADSPDQGTILVLPKTEDIHHPSGARRARPAPTLLLLVPLSPASLRDVMKEEIIKYEDKNSHL